jgi:hypothetical protein
VGVVGLFVEAFQTGECREQAGNVISRPLVVYEIADKPQAGECALQPSLALIV